MPHRPFTQPWADELCRVINADADYHEAAKGWVWPIAFILERAPTLGYPDGGAIEINLQRGTCKGVRLVTPRHAAAPYVFVASYSVWKELVHGQLDPIVAVMQRKLRLEKGALTTLMMHSRAAKALIACARKVETEFPDEDAGGE